MYSRQIREYKEGIPGTTMNKIQKQRLPIHGLDKKTILNFMSYSVGSRMMKNTASKHHNQDVGVRNITKKTPWRVVQKVNENRVTINQASLIVSEKNLKELALNQQY